MNQHRHHHHHYQALQNNNRRQQQQQQQTNNQYIMQKAFIGIFVFLLTSSSSSSSPTVTLLQCDATTTTTTAANSYYRLSFHSPLSSSSSSSSLLSTFGIPSSSNGSSSSQCHNETNVSTSLLSSSQYLIHKNEYKTENSQDKNSGKSNNSNNRNDSNNLKNNNNHEQNDSSVSSDETTDSALVGVKEHHHHHSHSHSSNSNSPSTKKSNAVGDPDGDDSDDDDDDSDNFSDWEDIFDDTIENQVPSQQQDHESKESNSNNSNMMDLDASTAQLQLEVEYVNADDEEEDNTSVNIPDGSLNSEMNAEIELNSATTVATTAEVLPEVEVQLSDNNHNNDDDDNNNTIETVNTNAVKSSGGIGTLFGLHGYNRSRRSRGGGFGRTHDPVQTTTTTTKVMNEQQKQQKEIEQQQQRTTNNKVQALDIAKMNAWQSHVYFPPTSSCIDYLYNNARTIDSSSKIRLDRRTLYAGLLLEWGIGAMKKKALVVDNNNNNNHKKVETSNSSPTSKSTRKFLDTTTSQALQAALSLATQPIWRKSFPRTSGIRLYDTIEKDVTSQQQQQDQSSSSSSSTSTTGSTVNMKGCTLAMQETIAMSLAHSLGAGFVVLDDKILTNVRTELLKSGFTTNDDDTKPVNLIKALLNHTTPYGYLSATIPKPDNCMTKTTTSASIATVMTKDLNAGLDDPFDERASFSCDEMLQWESNGFISTNSSNDNTTTNNNNSSGVGNTASAIIDIRNESNEKLPLVIFLRVEGSTSILKSKSTVDFLMKEYSSPESIHLLVLGKGIDVNTNTLPPEPVVPDTATSTMMTQEGMIPSQSLQSLPGAAPWFGFTPNNQNASGQNDPEGSRRFNIFLARTQDPTTGNPGIVGAIAPPQAGNLFPHIMAMQARNRLNHQTQQEMDENDSPMRGELERWAQMLQQQMQTSTGNPLPPPQFFNATFSIEGMDGQSSTPSSLPGLPPANLPPEIIQQALEHAMAELLDRLAKLNEEESKSSTRNVSPELQKAFTQILRNENFRKGIAENLARAAPALSDPKCQGVLLSVYVPPLPSHIGSDKPSTVVNEPQQSSPGEKMGGWFQNILNKQEENGLDTAQSKQKRVRTMAAAAAVMAAQNAQKKKNSKDTKDSPVTKQENKAERNLAKLEAFCRPIIVSTPSDPVRAKSWEQWISRERGSVIFRHNRRLLHQALQDHYLSLQEHTGTRGAGSSLRSMLSVRPITDEIEDVIKCAVELEAAKSQRLNKSPIEVHESERSLEVDITLSQLLLTEDCIMETEDLLPASVMAAAQKRKEEKSDVQFIHPSSLESALTIVCRINPSPAGALSVSTSSSPATMHRTRDDIAALAQDKHERALVSQVVLPQDIGVTYDMIGGLTEVKELLRQSITYPLKFPHLYCEGIAREAVKGVLLFGPPGTGKTMLAKAVATEGGASFLSVDASSVENKWLGESEKNAKAVFTLARRLAPCVIFIDEVDSLLSSRDGTSDDSAHGTLTSVKTTMMSEWDGLNSGTNGAGEAGSDRVVVIGSTNRPFDLDEAVLRRFPRRILVDLPDLNTRTEILEVTLAENRLDPSVNLTKIAERLEGYTGSDVKEICREAVVQISHEQAKLLDQGFMNNKEDITQGTLQRLRPVTSSDFDKALSKLKRSVSEKGRELARVWEWNDEYGEIKKQKKNHVPHLAHMYL